MICQHAAVLSPAFFPLDANKPGDHFLYGGRE